MKVIFILLFTFGEMNLIGYNRMLGNMAHSDNYHTEQSWLSKAHLPQWKDRSDKLHANRNKWEHIERIRLMKLMENRDYLSILYRTF